MTSDTAPADTAPADTAPADTAPADTATGASPAGRGRPRSADTTEAILEATHDLLKEQGYDHLRMQDVADRACSGLATIYRRWGTKPELVAAAMEHAPLEMPEPTGDPEADLRAFIAGMVENAGEDGEYLMSFIQAAREHPEIGAVVRRKVTGPMRDRLRALMVDVVGCEPPAIDLLMDAVMGAVVIRTTLMGRQIDPDAYGDEVVTLLRSIADR